MNWSAFFPNSWLWLVVGLAVFMSSIGIEESRISQRDAKHAKAEAAWTFERTAAANLRQLAEAQSRSEEKRRYDAQKAIQDDLQRKFEMVRSDAASASAASIRLQERIRTLAAAASKRPSNSGLATSSATAEDPIGMFANVLGRCSERIQLLAKTADERGAAGEFCERAYDSLAAP